MNARRETKILIVDDEAAARSALTEMLREEGFQVHSAADGFKALGQIETWRPDLVITDVKMPGMSGIELMHRIRELDAEIGVVVMTAFGSVENAVDAMQKGADDYLTKPLHFPELLIVVERVLESHSLRRENQILRERAAEAEQVDDWVCESKSSRDLMSLARQVAVSDATVLLVGDRGTGKTLVAKSLHRVGPRCERPFVVVHCGGAEPEEIEAEIFGRECADETDAQFTGLLAQADGGILFIEDVARLGASAQVRLLDFLQEQRFERVGGQATQVADVRLVASTDRDLRDEVSAGRFREDLFYRLNVITLRVPSLRQRREDIPELAMQFARRYGRQHQKRIRGFSERALKTLLGYEWPGNVRQLEQCIERAVVLCPGQDIEPKHLPRELMRPADDPDGTPVIPGASMAELERYAILKTLEHVRGSTSKAAEILGISPRKIQYRLAEYREADPSGTPAISRGPAEHAGALHDDEDTRR